MSAEKPSFFYGWVIVVFSAFMIGISNGLGIAALTVFDAKIIEEFGINLQELKTKDTLTLLVAACTGPFIGYLLDKIGVRPLIMFGFAVMGIGYYSFSSATDLQSLYLIHGTFGLVWSCCGLLVGVSLVSRWFVHKRGLALGIMLAGSSFGNALLPQVSAFLTGSMGLEWREATMVMMSIPLVMVPLAWLLVREKPEDKGLKMLGAEQMTAEQEQELSGYTYKEAIKTLNFWLIAVMAMLTFYGILAYLSNLFYFLKLEEYSDQQAATGMSVLFILGVIGKVIAGEIAERYTHKTTLLACIGMMFIGSLLFITTSGSMLWLAISVVGFGWGGLYTMIQFTTADIFGTRAIGAIIGTITFLDAMGGAMGPILTGRLFDQSGSYQLPFTIICVFIAIAFVCASFIKVPKDHKA